MSQPVKSISLAGRILASFAAPDIREAIVGDFEERIAAASEGNSGQRPLVGALRSLPALLADRLVRFGGSNTLYAMGAVALSFSVICAWDRFLVDRWSWPFTASYAEHTGLPPTVVVAIISSMLFVSGGIAILATLKTLERCVPTLCRIHKSYWVGIAIAFIALPTAQFLAVEAPALRFVALVQFVGIVTVAFAARLFGRIRGR
jgi:hypothetical protein